MEVEIVLSLMLLCKIWPITSELQFHPETWTELVLVDILNHKEKITGLIQLN